MDNTLRDLHNFSLIVKGFFLIYAILELRLSPKLIIVYPSLSSQGIFFFAYLLQVRRRNETPQPPPSLGNEM